MHLPQYTIAEKVAVTNQCELCDSNFKSEIGLKTHIGHAHKLIPQVDGSEELDNLFSLKVNLPKKT